MPLKRRLCYEAQLSCRRTLENGVWVTDEVLSQAFYHFLRYSYGAKRYGSNVPGPLEAQRRLAKRRMMALAGAGAAPVVDPNILFGRNEPILDKVIWQPPDKKEKTLSNTTFNDTAWLDRLGLSSESDAIFTSIPNKGDLVEHSASFFQFAKSTADRATAWVHLQEKLRYVGVEEMVQLAAVAYELGIEHVDFCKSAFRVLVDDEIRWTEVLDFLLNPRLNIPEAQHLTSLVSELGTRKLNVSDVEAGEQLIERCAKLGLLSDHELPGLTDAINKISFVHGIATVSSSNIADSWMRAIWRGLKACRTQDISPDIARLILDKSRTSRNSAFLFELYQHAFPLAEYPNEKLTLQESLVRWAIEAHSHKNSGLMTYDILTKLLEDLHPALVSVHEVVGATALLSHKLLSADFEATNHRWRILNRWLSCLEKSLPHNVWTSALETLASKGIGPLDLAEFFTQISRHHLVGDAILRFWIPKLPIPPKRRALKRQSLVYGDASGGSESFQSREVAKWVAVLGDYQFVFETLFQNSPHPHDSIVCLLVSLHRRRRLTPPIQKLLLEFCEGVYGVDALAQLCSQARLAGIRFSSQSNLHIVSRLAVMHPRLALKFYKDRATNISRVPELPPALIKAGVHSTEIFKILDRFDHRHYVPLRNRILRRCAISQDRVDLVHRCADAFSRDETYSIRTRFRNVYLCYKYLKVREAPIHSLMSRALVRAGITNYLVAGVNVNETQVKWILSVVEKVEGDALAQELDSLIFRWLMEVYARWTISKGRGVRRLHVPPQDTGFIRRPNGLRRWITPRPLLARQSVIPKVIRQYLDTGEWVYRSLGDLFCVREQQKSTGFASPTESSHNI
ncbi:uncharacterized protein PV09_05843 [Verruconis gallopava]|uniref:Uncharacterized protein n=1 Tax=Verruconis gallopava TaxID=253628 RepID=A0A0D1XKC6_9PEZI|nr:uncharacterized protein PV09_05843 [Verruconis gallopava]KIW02781.1 hypothetical protein PV09_05843 [Verruconis gallopava]